MNIKELKKQIKKLIPEKKPYLSKDGTEGMFSAQNKGIKYGEWELGNKILKLIEEEELGGMVDKRLKEELETLEKN